MATGRFINVALIAALVAIPWGFAGCAWVGGIVAQIGGGFADPAGVENIGNFSRTAGARLSVQWVGHSTVLLRMDDRVILTDPLLTGNVLVVKGRLVAPGIELDSLDRLDVILISHTHADHLSPGSLALIERRFPDAALVFAAGAEEFLPRYRFPLHRMAQADRGAGMWIGEADTIGGVKITTVASVHWGGRYGIDGSVWGFPGYTGYIVEYHGMTVYFPGDTGYDPELFRSIGDRFAIDLAFIPIAPCYDPESVGTRYHVGPAGAVKILEDTKACAMVPIHYGTLHEPLVPYDALEVFLGLAGKIKDPDVRVEILEIGELATFIR
jgi:L-ascorbate metabolism protein UlaG (beta-lactamase superfamily)